MKAIAIKLLKGLFCVFLFVLVAVGALGLLFSFFPSQVGGWVAESIQKNLNGSLSIDHLRISPRSIRAQNIVLKDSNETVLAEVQDLALDLSLKDCLSSRSLLGGIQKISLHKPYLLWERDKKGAVNWSGVIRPSAGAAPSREGPPAWLKFQGNVEMENGLLAFSDAAGNKHLSGAFHGIGGSLDFSGRDAADMAFRWAEKDAKTTCNYSCRGRLKKDLSSWNLSLKGDRLNASKWGNYLLNNPDLLVRGGTAEVALLMNGNFGSEAQGGSPVGDLQGDVTLNKVSLKLKGLPQEFSKIDGALLLTNDFVSIDSLRGFWGSIPFAVSGDVCNFISPKLSLLLKAPRISLEDLSGYLGLNKGDLLKGEASAVIKIRGDAMNPLIEGTLTSSRCRIFSQPISGVSLDFFNQFDLWHFKDFRANWLGSSISGSGLALADKSPVFLFDIKAHSFDPLAGMVSMPMKALSGKGEVELSVMGEGTDPIILGNAHLSGLESRFVYGGRNLWLDGRLGRRGSVVARGLVDPFKDRLNLSFLAFGRGIPALKMPGWGTLSCSADVKGQVQGSFSSPFAWGEISRGELSLGRFFAGDIKGSLLYKERSLLTAGMHVKLGGNPVFLQGFKNFGAGEELYLSAISPRLSLAPAGSSTGLSVKAPAGDTVSVETEISGRGGSYALQGSLKRRSGGRLGLSARYGRDGVWWALGKLNEVELGGLLSPGESVPGPAGKVNGTVFLGGGKKRGIFLVDGAFKNFSPSGISLETVRADGSWDGGKLSIADLYLAGDAAALSLSGSLVPARRLVDLKWEVPRLEISKITDGLSLPAWKKYRESWGQPLVGGTASGNGVIRGTFPDLELVGDLDVYDGFAGYSPFALKAAFAVSPDEITLEPLRFSQSSGQYQLSGKVGLGKSGKLNLFLEAEQGSLSTLLALTPWAGWNLRGSVDSNLRIQGTLKGPLLSGSLNLRNLYVGNHRIRRVKASFAPDSAKVGTDIDFSASIMQGRRLLGSLNVNPLGSLKGRLAAGDFPLEVLADLNPSLTGLSGVGNLELALSGTYADPEAHASFNIQAPHFRRLIFDSLKGIFTYDKKGFSIDSLSLVKGAGQYDFSGFLPNGLSILPLTWKRLSGKGASPQSKGVSLRAEVRHGRLEDVLAFSGYSQAKEFSGELNGTLTAEGLYAAPAMVVKLSLDKGNFGSVPVSNTALDSKFSGTTLTVDNFAFQGGGGSASAQGIVDLQGKTALTVGLQSMDMRLLGLFLPQARQLGGLLDLQFEAGGLTAMPEITASFDVKKGFLGWLSFDSFNGYGGASGGIVSLKELRLIKGKHQARAAGSLPLAMKDGKLVSEGPLILKASLDEDDLDSLNALGNIVSRSSGKMRGDVSISGTASDIRMEGSLEVKNGSLTLARLKNPIKDLWVRIFLKGERLAIEEFKGKMGAGSFSLQGTADFDKSHLAEVDLGFVAKAIQILRNDFSATLTTPHGVTLKGQRGARPLLSGELSVSDATIKIPTAQPTREGESQSLSAATASIPADIDVALTLEKNVWLSLNVARLISSSLNSKGSVVFRKKSDKTQLGGDIHFNSGTVTLFSRPFRLVSGLAHFDGSESAVPELDINLETKAGDSKVFADVSGRPPNLSVRLTSDPPISQAKIEGKLISGMADSALVGLMDTGFLQPITLAIQRSFGLSDVSYDYTMSGAQSLRVAKAFGPDERLLLSFTRLFSGLGEIQRIWGLEYLLFKRTILKFTQDDKGVNTFGIQSRFYF
ncbi:MAG: translocation/assembly module TamB domain-containing protein [bacterium]